MAALGHLVRIRGEDAAQAGRGVAVVEVHARIVEEVGFRDADLPAVGVDEQREERQAVPVPLADLVDGVGVLEGVVELAFEGLRVLGYVRDVQVPVLREEEFRFFGADREVRLAAGDEAVRDARVIGAEVQDEVLEGQRELVVAVAHLGLLVDDRLHGPVGLRRHGLRRLRGAAVDGPVRKGHRDLRGGDEADAFCGDGVGEVLPGIDFDDQFPVGGGEGILFRGGGGGEGQRAEAQGEDQFFHGHL